MGLTFESVEEQWNLGNSQEQVISVELLVHAPPLKFKYIYLQSMIFKELINDILSAFDGIFVLEAPNWKDDHLSLTSKFAIFIRIKTIVSLITS